MKKIIINKKQLDETIGVIPDKNDTLGDILTKTATDNGNNTVNTDVNKNIKDLEKINPGNVTVLKNNSALNVKNPNTQNNGGNYFLNMDGNKDQFQLKQNSLMEKTYTKKQVEEVRSIKHVMTKRQLMEELGTESDLEQVYSALDQKLYGYELSLNNYRKLCEEFKRDLQGAIELVKTSLQDVGLNATDISVDFQYSSVEITINTDWSINPELEDYYDDPEEYKRYKYLSNLGYKTTGYGRRARQFIDFINIEFHEDYSDGSNPYFTITADFPEFGDE